MSNRSIYGIAAMLTIAATFTPLEIVSAHAGHGNEFKGGSTPPIGGVQVDADAAKRLGLKVETVTRQRLAVSLKTTGQIETLPNRQVEVTTPVGGTVLRLLVKPGDVVDLGQPVAVMTSPDLADLRSTAMDRKNDAVAAVQTAKADVQLGQQNLDRQRIIADQEVLQDQSAFEVAQETYNKDQQLVQAGALPKRTALESGAKLAAARSALAKAQTRLSVSEAEAQLKRAQVAVELAQARVGLSGQAYETRLRQLGANANEDGTITIFAPIAGTVTDRETTTGESTKDPGKKILSIVNGSNVQVSSNVNEKDINQIQTGQSVRIKVNGLPNRVFAGRISVIGTAVQGETRTVSVKAELENTDGTLKPGMFAEIEVLTDRTPVAVLVVPKSALVETNDKKKIVFVENGNAFQATDVTLGRESGEFIEVTNGILDGDKVVTQRAPQLYAQSLRGAVASANHESSSNNSPSATPPWTNILIVGGILLGLTGLSAGLFWAGLTWGRQRDRSALRELNPDLPHDPEPIEPSVASQRSGPNHHV